VSEVELNEPSPAGGYSVALPMFEGPLDLLLHLCQKHELDILDIPISFVTEKYLEYLAVMQLLNLDVASEYLVMAATLAHIKSKMLLPAPPPGQEDELAAEEEDPRESLIRRLLEYQKYKQAGEELATRGVAQQNVFMRGMPMEEAVHTGLPPLAQVPLFSLVEAFQNVLSKSNVKLSHDIVHERVTLADRINELVDILRVKRRITFEELFIGLTTRFDLVITFLALLEMTRLRMTRLFQADFDSQIYIEFTAQPTADDDGQFGTEPATAFDTEAPPPGSADASGPRTPAAHDEAFAPAETIPAPAPTQDDDAWAREEDTENDATVVPTKEAAPRGRGARSFADVVARLARLEATPEDKLHATIEEAWNEAKPSADAPDADVASTDVASSADADVTGVEVATTAEASSKETETNNDEVAPDVGTSDRANAAADAPAVESTTTDGISVDEMDESRATRGREDPERLEGQSPLNAMDEGETATASSSSTTRETTPDDGNGLGRASDTGDDAGDENT
jgi:segregation and condensation protein A